MSAAEHGARLWDGAAELARSYVQWLWSDGAGRALVRVLGGVLAAVFFILMVQGTRWLMWVALGVALVASYATGGAAEQDTEEDEPADWTPDDTLDLTRELIGEARGALLTVLRDAIEAEAPGLAPDTKAVRALLAEAVIPVTEGVRTAEGNGPGVRADRLPPPSPTSESGPVGDVAAGEDANTNANNTPSVTEIGLGGYSVHEGPTNAPVQRRRHHATLNTRRAH